MPIRKAFRVVIFVSICLSSVFAQSKPKLTFDEFFNAVSFNSLEMSPDGASVIIGTERADWDQQIFRHDLWLYRADGGALIQFTQSGHDTDPQWSPDGKWIAFLSDRKSSSAAKEDDSDSSSKDDSVSQLYLISPQGGEAFAITQGDEDVHAFAWSADSQTLYFATRVPWSQQQKDDYRKEWKDVEQYRTAERGDNIYALNLADALSRHAAAPTISASDRDKDKGSDKKKDKDKDETEPFTPGAQLIASIALRVDHIVISPDGYKLAFLTNAINQRQEKVEDVELYVCNLGVQSNGPQTVVGSDEKFCSTPRRLTNNQAVETRPRWAADSRHLFFSVEVGDVSGPYRDLQPHLYWVDSDSSKVEQWSKDFLGSVDGYAVNNNSVLTSARLGTEVQIYSAATPAESLHKLTNWPGTYDRISVGAHSPKIAFIYSSLTKPAEIYLADSTDKDKLNDARPITSFNKVLAAADLPQGKPYTWKADDGTTVEGMLIYPPGKFEQKHLHMLTLIHGGPADADGNSLSPDWYDWATLAATNGWLVFRPNYRGSTGYGDKFLTEIVPQIVSRPGKDILEGVDALVKDGIADPDHLVIGGYSYGGYMTNWLITQTTRFKAAVTGAGAVEHIGNWGNDDTTMDDAYFLGGRPWEAAQRYHDEAAIFQIDKVRTPTHMVAGADDIRVAVLEDYLLEHALYSLGIPNKLLIFPGEGHSLDKNPWHGRIKVREELKWLEKYGGVQ